MRYNLTIKTTKDEILQYNIDTELTTREKYLHDLMVQLFNQGYIVINGYAILKNHIVHIYCHEVLENL